MVKDKRKDIEMNEKDEESERDADYKEWNYWQEQMNEKDEEGCEGGCVCCGFEDLKDDDASKKKKNNKKRLQN